MIALSENEPTTKGGRLDRKVAVAEKRRQNHQAGRQGGLNFNSAKQNREREKVGVRKPKTPRMRCEVPTDQFPRRGTQHPSREPEKRRRKP